MISFIAIFLVVMITLFMYTIHMGIRNENVFKFRTDILDQVFAAGIQDVLDERDWQWRYEVYKSVSYSKMLYSFKPLRVESFWGSDEFIK